MDEQTTSPQAPALLRRDDGRVATLTLNRPDKFNALSVDLLTALQEQLAAHRRGPEHPRRRPGRRRQGVLHRPRPEGDAARTPANRRCRRCSGSAPTSCWRSTRLPQPVIARVHGVATAAGCQLVATCDLAVAADDARFAVSGVNLGLFCSTPMVALTRNLPRKQAMEMLLTGSFIDAATALRYGLVNRVVPHDRARCRDGRARAAPWPPSRRRRSRSGKQSVLQAVGSLA